MVASDWRAARSVQQQVGNEIGGPWVGPLRLRKQLALSLGRSQPVVPDLLRIAHAKEPCH